MAKQAVAALRARLGADPAGWQWERVHIAHWRHPLSSPVLAGAFDIGPAPVDGGSHTVRNTGGELPPHGASSGAEYRIVVDFADPSSFLAVQNIGNSGVPGQPALSRSVPPLDRWHLPRGASDARRRRPGLRQHDAPGADGDVTSLPPASGNANDPLLPLLVGDGCG